MSNIRGTALLLWLQSVDPILRKFNNPAIEACFNVVVYLDKTSIATSPEFVFHIFRLSYFGVPECISEGLS